MVGKYLSAVAAAALVASPVMAANPTATPSVSKSVRTGTSAKQGNELAGGGGFFVAIIAAIAVIAGVIIVANNDDEPDSP